MARKPLLTVALIAIAFTVSCGSLVSDADMAKVQNLSSELRALNTRLVTLETAIKSTGTTAQDSLQALHDTFQGIQTELHALSTFFEDYRPLMDELQRLAQDYAAERDPYGYDSESGTDGEKGPSDS